MWSLGKSLVSADGGRVVVMGLWFGRWMAGDVVSAACTAGEWSDDGEDIGISLNVSVSGAIVFSEIASVLSRLDVTERSLSECLLSQRVNYGAAYIPIFTIHIHFNNAMSVAFRRSLYTHYFSHNIVLQ